MIKDYFGYLTPEELDEKMKLAHEERDAYLPYDVRELDFVKTITKAKEAKEKLLSSLSPEVREKFDEKGRAFIKVEDLEDEDYRIKAVQKFRGDLDYKERAYLFEFTEKEFLEGKVEKDKLVVIDDQETLTISAGSRMGRVLRKIYKKAGFSDDHIERIVQAYSLINNEKVSGYLVLSVNVFDFFTMSWGQNWSSCMDAGGEYETGSLSWATDSTSFIGYLISEEDHDIIINEETTHQKRWRKMFTLDETKSMLLANRGYPYDGETLTRELILSVFPFHYCYDSKEYAGLHNRIIASSKGQLYNDVIRGNKVMLFTNVEYEQLGTGDERTKFFFGEEVLCLKCSRYLAQQDAFMGECCHATAYCECCDEVVEESESTWLDLEEMSVCDHCLSEYFCFSEVELEYIHIDEAVWVDSLDTYVREDDPLLRYCEDCGEAVYDNGKVCTDCLENRAEEEAAKLKEEDVIQ